MAARHELRSFEEFLAAIARAGVRGVGLRTVREIRPKQLENFRVEIGRQHWLELAGYVKGELYVARLESADADAIERELKARGLEVKRDSGNIS